MSPEPIRILEATAADGKAIDELRHRVYALELRQYPPSNEGRLADSHPGSSILCAKRGEDVLGFIAITPPGSRTFRLEHYLDRGRLPFALGPHTAEARQLTVAPEARKGTVGARLLFACIAWLEEHSATDVVSIGHDAVLPTYQRWGATRLGIRFHAGSIEYEVLHASMDAIRLAAGRLGHLRKWIAREDSVAQRRSRGTCIHGGAALHAAGEGLDRLEALESVVDADVLDAWFPPSPRVLDALARGAARLSRTSPPPAGDSLVSRLADRWAIPRERIAIGAGSSDLIFRALGLWLNKQSRVLVLDPSYGEYAHVAGEVLGASVDRLVLERTRDYELSIDRLRAELSKGYDLVVVVNPNSPTGTHVERAVLRDAFRAAPSSTRIWIDEAYVHFLPESESLVPEVAASRNLFVCRTFSKALALSGLRVAVLVGPEHDIAELRGRTPPWIAGFAAQVAVLRALEDPDYYHLRYGETVALRRELTARLREAGLDVFEGRIASILVHLGEDAPTAKEVCRRCAQSGVFLRDARDFGPSVGERVIRISVKDRASNARIVELLREALHPRGPAEA